MGGFEIGVGKPQDQVGIGVYQPLGLRFIELFHGFINSFGNSRSAVSATSLHLQYEWTTHLLTPGGKFFCRAKGQPFRTALSIAHSSVFLSFFARLFSDRRRTAFELPRPLRRQQHAE